jgi:hypothetical protein
MTHTWIPATAADLKLTSVFRYPSEDRPAVVTARWDEGGEVRFLSRDLATFRAEGLSILNPGTPVEIRK